MQRLAKFKGILQHRKNCTFLPFKVLCDRPSPQSPIFVHHKKGQKNCSCHMDLILCPRHPHHTCPGKNSKVVMVSLDIYKSKINWKTYIKTHLHGRKKM